MALVEIEGLNIAFGARRVIDGLTLRIGKGERFGLIGESGSGKSLTALAIAGLLPETAQVEGSIRFDGAPLPASERAMARLRGKRIGMVFQEPMTALNPLMRVGDQVAEAMRLTETAGAPQIEVPSLFVEVGLELAHAHRFPHQLSGGQRQRAMIAMALAGKPELMIADEPTSALDVITQRKVLDLIAEVCTRRQMTLLFISHDIKAVGALCARVAVMQAGRLVEQGKTAAVLGAPRVDYTRRLVAASRMPKRPPARPPIGTPLLSVEGVTRDYAQGGLLWWREKPLRAVDGVRFAVGKAECLAIVGPSGCGKTTLARMIVGLDTATAGQMRLGETAYRGTDLPPRRRADVSLVFQDPFGSFDPRMTVGDSIGEPLRLLGRIGAGERRARLVEAIEAVGMETAMLERYPHEFSGGQRQRLAIARALVTRPRLVVLDEPVSALDMSVRGEVLALLARLQADHDLTYVIISHDLDMIGAMADRVLVMDVGRIVEEGRPAELFAHPQHPLTRALMAARLPEVA